VSATEQLSAVDAARWVNYWPSASMLSEDALWQPQPERVHELIPSRLGKYTRWPCGAWWKIEVTLFFAQRSTFLVWISMYW